MCHYVGMETRIAKYLLGRTNASYRTIGEAVGMSHTTVRRQLTGQSELSAKLVVDICRAYNLDPLQALVAADIITAEEANYRPNDDLFANVTDVELAEEILRRAQIADGDKWRNETITNIADKRKESTVNPESFPYAAESGTLPDDTEHP